MSSKANSQDVNLSHKFYIIPEPVHLSHSSEEEIEGANYQWLAKSRALQARRWRKINDQED
jgi:hypothetical protein